MMNSYRNYRISLCIVCMNRTMHLKETLARNITDNLHYENLEIVLLDYNSADDMLPWVEGAFSQYIESGQLCYYKTPEPQYFSISHAKNMAFRLATGDILCSVDADNFTGYGFAAYVNKQFNEQQKCFLCSPRIGKNKRWWDVQGRLCCRREDFYALRGYDEDFMHYGYEDQDLKSRLVAAGRTRTTITGHHYLHAITHGNDLRIACGEAKRSLEKMLWWQACPHSGEVISLMGEKRFEKYHIRSTEELPGNGCLMESLKITRVQRGYFEPYNNGLTIFRDKGTLLLRLREIGATNDYYAYRDKTFLAIPPGEFQNHILLHRAIHSGYQQLTVNRKTQREVNPQGFGQGCAFRLKDGVVISL